MRRFLFSFLAAGTLALAAGVPDSDSLFRDLSSPSISSWAIADLDGDQKADLVTAGPGRHDAQGYSHDVGIRFAGSPEEGSFTFRGRSANVRVSIRDLDGDRDGDIVILEGSSPKAVGVWLNDGSGHFHEEDVASFRTALNQAPWALWLPEKGGDISAAAPQQRLDPAMLPAGIREPGRAHWTVLCKIHLDGSRVRHGDRRPRAPPVRL